MKLVHAYYFIIIIFAFIISDDQDKIYNLKIDLNYVCQDLSQTTDIYTHKICGNLDFPKSN